MKGVTLLPSGAGFWGQVCDVGPGFRSASDVDQEPRGGLGPHTRSLGGLPEEGAAHRQGCVCDKIHEFMILTCSHLAAT